MPTDENNVELKQGAIKLRVAMAIAAATAFLSISGHGDDRGDATVVRTRIDVAFGHEVRQTSTTAFSPRTETCPRNIG